MSTRPIVHLTLALLLTLMVASSAWAAGPGGYMVVFQDLSEVKKTQRADGTVSMALKVPAGETANVLELTWPADAPFVLPDTVTHFVVHFDGAIDAGQSDSILDTCLQSALLLQAKPERYNLRVWVDVPDVAGSWFDVSKDQLNATLNLGYRTSCNLRK